MIIKEKEVILKNGKKILLRSLHESDAKAFYEHRLKTTKESCFVAQYPEEVRYSEEEMAQRAKVINGDDMSFLLFAFDGNKIVADGGVLKIRDFIKYCHRGEFGISIQEEYCNLGLGSIILQESIKIAKENGFEQIELGVFEDNPRAIHLYEKAGFQKVGVWPRAFKLKDGTYRDEILMTLVL